jgi:copper chaperone CopZ
MRTFFTFLVALFLLSCGQGPTPMASATNAVRTESEVVISAGTPVATADLSISGMTCGMGCGGAIKSALAKLPGVQGTEIDFKSAEEANHAVVTYDPAKVTDAQLIQAVQAIHDGQYKVGAVGVTKQVLSSGSVEAPAEGEEAQVKASISNVVFPSIVALLSRLLRV